MPDKAQLPVRARALTEGKIVYMAVPRLAEEKPVDLIVCGSVAVNRHGTRLGKGAGCSDIEVALLQEAGLIGPHTTIVTTVHSLQVVDEPLPETEHDFSVDLIVTPDDVITCGPPRRPHGLIWTHLSAEKIARRRRQFQSGSISHSELMKRSSSAPVLSPATFLHSSRRSASCGSAVHPPARTAAMSTAATTRLIRRSSSGATE